MTTKLQVFVWDSAGAELREVPGDPLFLDYLIYFYINTISFKFLMHNYHSLFVPSPPPFFLDPPLILPPFQVQGLCIPSCALCRLFYWFHIFYIFQMTVSAPINPMGIMPTLQTVQNISRVPMDML